MSRRKRRPGAAEPVASSPEEARPSGPRASRRLALDLGILVAVFAVTVGIAELAGAANLGVAIGVGQVTFAIVLVALMLRA
jgi:hypothetical protein